MAEVEYDPERAKANAIDWLKMQALKFRVDGDTGNARMAEAVAAQIACDFNPLTYIGAQPVFDGPDKDIGPPHWGKTTQGE